nr:hypothetical protein [Escherichia coli]
MHFPRCSYDSKNFREICRLYVDRKKWSFALRLTAPIVENYGKSKADLIALTAKQLRFCTNRKLRANQLPDVFKLLVTSFCFD